MTEEAEGPRKSDEAHDFRVLGEERDMCFAALERVPIDCLAEVSARVAEFACPERGDAQEVLALHDEYRIRVALPGVEQRDPVLPRVGDLESQEGGQREPPNDVRTHLSSEPDEAITAPRVIGRAPAARRSEQGRALRPGLVAARA